MERLAGIEFLARESAAKKDGVELSDIPMIGNIECFCK
jgi:hypothetical protein